MSRVRIHNFSISLDGFATGEGQTIEGVELATLGWVHWHNTERLHGYLDEVPQPEHPTNPG